MSNTHNKKRNVGIVYEQLINVISSYLVEGDLDKADNVIGLIKTHFQPGSELYKEFRLFNALVKTTVSSDSLASRILEEAKIAAKDHDATKLRKEKSLLIKDINLKISKDEFYGTRVENYRTYATIQTVLNGWRSKSPNIRIVAEYEDKVHTWLREDKTPDTVEEHITPDIDRLTVKLMREKFDDKYKNLSCRQKYMLSDYMFDSTAKNEKLKENLATIQKDLIVELTQLHSSCENSILRDKMPSVIENVTLLNPETLNDENISKFLLAIKLCEEITEKIDE